MKPLRLPPQPTDTALARLVQRIIDSMPWIMARHLREERRAVAKLGATVRDLLEANYQLRRDYIKLFDRARSPAFPVIDEVRVDFSRNEMSMELQTRLTVHYRSMTASVIYPARATQMEPLSAVAVEALRHAAHEIAYGSIDEHRDNLIRIATHGKTIEELMKL